MSSFELPENWIKLQLGDVISYGKTNKIEAVEISDDTWVLELEDIEKNISKINKYVTFAERKPKSTKNKFEKGDVLYGKLRPYLNKIVMASDSGVCTTEIIPLSGGQYIDSQYLFYWLKHPEFSTYVTQVSYGVNMPRLGTKDGVAAPFVLSPLAEQKQIATKLDQLLSQVNTLKKRLDNIPTILKRFRQSVLAAAVSGKLTEEWRERNKISKSNNKNLKKVIKSLDQGWSPKCINEPAGFDEWGVIKTSSVQPLKFVSVENKTLPKSLEARPKLSLKKGEILITRAGPRVRCGVTCIVDKDYTNLMICDKVYRIRVDEEETIPMYLNIVLNSPQHLNDIEKMKTGISESGMNLTQKKFYQLSAWFPELEEQNIIVEQVEQLIAYSDQIEKQVKSAQTRVNNLTQSILAKAFRGELTAEWREQNPDLISGENSVEALLKKIKAERQSIQKNKPKRTAKKKKSKLKQFNLNS